MDKKRFYMTTAIAYASAKPHFGNTYEIIMADAYARYKRLRGYDVRFMTGTDEHGQKIQNLAKESGLEPQAYVDKMSGVIKDIWGLMGSSHDHFIRTTDDYHKTAVKNIFKKLYDKGDIYKGSYKGLYCTPCESFFTETQLVDGKCPDCSREVTHAEEEAYFFKMSNYADRLMKHLEENPDFIQPESRKNEMVNNFLKPGLQDLCVSRTSFSWGIPVEFDPKHVTYVWLDALTNYITGLGYDPANEVQPELFQKYWPVDVHIIGKDIVRFHMIYWPIILMALDLPLPKKIFAHPWFMFGKDKMSKSRGNVVYADKLAEKFGVDGVRHYALSEMPYGTDGSITYETVISRYNMDLANNLGNLVSRTVSMAKKYFGGVIPTPAEENELDCDLKEKCASAFEKMCEHMDEFRIADAVSDIFDMLSRTNKYIDETAPWVLAKNENDKARLGTVIYNLLEAIRIGAVMLSPMIPSTCAEIFRQINTDKTTFEDIKFGSLVCGVSVADNAPNLFQRIDEKAFFEALEKEQEAEKVPEKPEGCAIIGIDKFAEIELRTAQIIACENVPKAKKLLKLQLDLGYEKRQVVSGIAQYYKPEDLIGKKVIVVANLAPAKLCGVESQGMILASSGDTVRVVFLDGETPNGQRIS